MDKAIKKFLEKEFEENITKEELEIAYRITKSEDFEKEFGFVSASDFLLGFVFGEMLQSWAINCRNLHFEASEDDLRDAIRFLLDEHKHIKKVIDKAID